MFLALRAGSRTKMQNIAAKHVWRTWGKFRVRSRAKITTCDHMTEPSRRFPAPWKSDRIPGGYVVRDATGQIVAWVYARASTAEAIQAKVLTLDEARRIATNIARLPDLLGHER